MTSSASSIARICRGSQLYSGDLLGTSLHWHKNPMPCHLHIRQTFSPKFVLFAATLRYIHIVCLLDFIVGKFTAELRALVTMITPHWPMAT